MKHRRLFAGVLLGVGVVLMLFAPEPWTGLLLIVLALVIEGVGITLERKQ